MTIDQQLTKLRAEWKANPSRRQAIELQAKVLQAAKNAPKYIPENFYLPKDVIELEKNAKEILMVK